MSFEFPNYKMFYSLRKRDEDADWVVILYDAKIICDFDCAFCTTNAGSREMFSIPIESRKGRELPVEVAFQASKVFENGGPFRDLLLVTPREAKRDMRLKDSGKLLCFDFFGRKFPLNPPTYFYNWLYINSLNSHKELS